MPTLSQIAVNRARFTIPLEDGADPLWISYQPNTITPRSRAAFQMLEQRDFADLSAEEQDEAMRALTALLAGTVLAWNLTDNDGTPVVPTEQGLENVDYNQQMWLLGKIMADQRQGEASAKTSSGASSSPALKVLTPPNRASRRSRPIGAATRPSRTGSA